MNRTCQKQVEEAEGLAELGLWPEAWEVIGKLPRRAKTQPPVARLALDCCSRLGQWGAGEIFVESLRRGETYDKRAAAIFFLQRAHFFPSQAAGWLAAAIEIFPNCAENVLADPVLAELLLASQVGCVKSGN